MLVRTRRLQGSPNTALPSKSLFPGKKRLKSAQFPAVNGKALKYARYLYCRCGTFAAGFGRCFPFKCFAWPAFNCLRFGKRPSTYRWPNMDWLANAKVLISDIDCKKLLHWPLSMRVGSHCTCFTLRAMTTYLSKFQSRLSSLIFQQSGCFCGGVVVFLWWCLCGGVCVVVFLWWCFCGGVVVVVFLWWCFCGGVFVVVFLWVVLVWWCSGVFVVVFCVFVVVLLYVLFCQGSTFVALPRSYAKSVDNTGVKRCLVSKFSLHCSYPHSHQTFPSFNCLHCFRDIRRLVSFGVCVFACVFVCVLFWVCFLCFLQLQTVSDWPVLRSFISCWEAPWSYWLTRRWCPLPTPLLRRHWWQKTKYYSVLQSYSSTTLCYKLLFHTTKCYSSTTMYYKVLLRTTLYYRVLLRTAKSYSSTTKYY